MDLNYIKEFVILAQTQNFLEASELLYIAQSSLSKHIARLEKELGEPLFNRTTRKVELNEAGKLFLTYAQEISKLDSACKHAFKERKKIRNHTITIGMGYRLFESISLFFKKYPDYQLNIIEGRSEAEINSLLKNEKCDIGFTISEGTEDTDIIKFPYLTEQYVLVVPASHPLAARDMVSLQELEDEHFIMLPEDSSVTRFVVNAFQKNRLHLHIALTGLHGSNIIDFIKQGLGISIMPQLSLTNLITSEIRLIPLSPQLTSEVVICHRKNSTLSSSVQAFIDFVLHCTP